MPKHLILFAAFLALLVAVFYYPIPDPEIWDADSRHVLQPDYSIPGIKPAPENIADWSDQLKASYQAQHQVKTLSSIQ